MLLIHNLELGPRPELLQTLFNTPKTPESENCLRINVFAPDSASNVARAVLVFIHGGGYQLGHARIDLSSFAAYEDIIIVSLQYRTNGPASFLPVITCADMTSSLWLSLLTRNPHSGT